MATGAALPSGSLAQLVKDSSMNEAGVENPSPAQEDWAWVEAVCPSTPAESYPTETCGTREERAGGTLIGTW